jgi:hypothetical protein
MHLTQGVTIAKMLLLVTVVLALVLLTMTVNGGILTSPDRHRKWFIIYGVVGLILVISQGIFQYREDKKHSGNTDKLVNIITNLRDQVFALNNALRLQVSVDDIHRLETAITTGFGRLESVVREGRPSGKPVQQAAPPQSLPPAVVEHVRIVQRRAASDDPNAPYGLQVVMQTDVTMQPVAFKVECDHEITQAKAFIVGEGLYMSVGTAYSSDRRAFMFSWKYPPFTPSSSLIVNLLSKDDIRVTKVEKIQPLL